MELKDSRLESISTNQRLDQRREEKGKKSKIVLKRLVCLTNKYISQFIVIFKGD